MTIKRVVRRPARPDSQRAALGFILVTVTLDMLAASIVIPVLPKLILTLLHGNAVRAAGWLGVFRTIWAIMQFFCAPLQGALSDRFVRRSLPRTSALGWITF
jgi:DHA1 family tetracycline resistance protein-like MFS transporter